MSRLELAATARCRILERQAEHGFVVTGDRFQLGFIRGLKRPAAFPSVLGRWYDPEIAVRIADNPVLRTGTIHENGCHAARWKTHPSSLAHAVAGDPGLLGIVDPLVHADNRVGWLYRARQVRWARQAADRDESSICIL